MPTTIIIPQDATGKPGAEITNSGTLTRELTGAAFQDTGAVNSGSRIVLTVVGFGTQQPKIYTYSAGVFTQVAVFDFTFTSNPVPVKSNGTNFWQVYANSNKIRFKKFDENGTTIKSSGDATANQNFGTLFCIANDESVAYFNCYVTGFFNQPIQIWDLTTNTLTGNLIPNLGGSNLAVLDLFPIAGSTDIIAILYDTDETTYFKAYINRYKNDGTLVYNVKFADITITDPDPNAAAEAGLDPSGTSVWVRWADTGNAAVSSKYTNLLLSDGSTASEFTLAVNGDGAPCTTCPLLILGQNSDSGLYQVVRDKRNDTLWSSGNVKIPDPFVKTGLFSQ